MNENPNRQPKGTPTGGQFAASAHAEAEISLPVPHDDISGSITPEIGERIAREVSDYAASLSDALAFTGGCCSQCGGEVLPDPDGSPGVVAHGDGDGYPDYDTDLDHAPVLDDAEDNAYQSARSELLGILHGDTIGGKQIRPLASVHTASNDYDQVRVNHGATPYRLGQFVEDGPVRVAFVDLGEGYNGDYDEDDPEDEPLLRVDVAVRADTGIDGEYAFTDRGVDWVNPDSYSWCTNINRDAVQPEDQQAFLASTAKMLRDQVEHRAQYPGALTSAMEMLSHADTDLVQGAAARAQALRAEQDRAAEEGSR